MKLLCRPSGWGLVLAGLLLAGCATPKIDWAQRVGHYTFDQAVMELGPPDKEAKLTNGARVADWMTRRGRTPTVATWGGYNGPGWGHSAPVYVGGASPDYFLRLHFDVAGQLTAWGKYAR